MGEEIKDLRAELANAYQDQTDLSEQLDLDVHILVTPDLGVVYVCHRDASILFDLGSTYSYVSSYFAYCLDMPRVSLVTLVHISTTVGDYVMVDQVYRSCVVTISGFEMRVDFLLLDMVDFDVILGIDWLSLYHGIPDYHIKTMLSMPVLPRLEWKGFLVKYTSTNIVESVSIIVESVPVVREYPDVFLVDLPGMTPDKDIDFSIDFSSDT
ncbi:uncharacterized protein [Nicotiana tomentosiformis]|uniref:uncharacterized protein n=1 Tax=Nicotiana tomentosiformis TaxID=4098 RepID=UPI00388CD0E6